MATTPAPGRHPVEPLVQAPPARFMAGEQVHIKGHTFVVLGANQIDRVPDGETLLVLRHLGTSKPRWLRRAEAAQQRKARKRAQ